MRRIITLLYIAVVSAALTGNTYASFPGEVRWHNETADTTKINRILIDASNLADKTPNELMAYIGMRFEGTPYVAGTLEGDPEMLTISMRWTAQLSWKQYRQWRSQSRNGETPGRISYTIWSNCATDRDGSTDTHPGFII